LAKKEQPPGPEAALGQIRIIAFLTDSAVVDTIIEHLKLTFVADVCTLFAGCERATGSFPRPRAIPAVLDIFSSHDLHFPMMVGGENCRE
jgi:hypothetical protein